MFDPDAPIRYSRRRAKFRYAVRHAPAGGVEIGGKQFRGGMFIPEGDYNKADPATKVKIDQGQGKLTGEDAHTHHLESLPAGHAIQVGNQTFVKKNGGSWQRKGSNHWLSPAELWEYPGAREAVTAHLATLPEHQLPPTNTGETIAPTETVDHPPSDTAPVPGPSQGAPGALPGPSQKPPEPVLDLRNIPIAPAPATQQPNTPTEPVAQTPPAQQQAQQSNTSPEPNTAGDAQTPPPAQLDPKDAIAGLMHVPVGEKVAGFERRPGDAWKDEKGTPWPTDAMARYLLRQGKHAEVQQAMQQHAPAPPPPKAPRGGKKPTQKPPAGPDALHATLEAIPAGTKAGGFEKIYDPATELSYWKQGEWLYTSQQFAEKHPDAAQAAAGAHVVGQQTAPGQKTAPRGKLDPTKMHQSDRHSLSMVAGMFGINPGDMQNLDRASNYVLLAARKLGLNPKGADKTQQTAHAVRYLAKQKPGLDAITQAAEQMGYKGRATNLVARAKGAQEYIIKQAMKGGYRGTGQFDRADFMAALQHLAGTQSAVQPGPPPAPDQPAPKSSWRGILQALEQKAGGRRNLLLASGALAALAYAFGAQQKRMFFDKAHEGGYRVMRYAEP